MRTRLRKRSHLIMASTLLATAIVFGLLCTVRLVAFASPDPVRAALEHARQAGTYHFNADVEQLTDPVPSVRNAGRTSRRNAMHMQGDNDLHARTMDMQLWNQGGNIRTGEGHLEVRVENDTTYIRKPGQAWQEQDSVTDIAAPNGDFLTYLDATRNVQEAGTHQHTLPDGKTIAYTRYTFDMHGPTLAEHMRLAIQQQLTEQGELPPGLNMAKPKLYEEMQGSGELWVTHDGLPLRQILNLEFPEQDDEQVRSSISVTFSGFARPPPAATWRWWVNSGAVGSILQQWSANHGRDMLYAMFAIMLIGMFGFLLVTQYHSRRLRSTLSMLLCLVIITGPLLQNLRVADFGTTRKALAAEQEQQQAEYDEHQERINSYIETDYNPHANPIEQAKIRSLQNNGETLRATSPRNAINADEWDHLMENDDGTDSDGDGLTDAQEELLGTTASGDYADDTDDDDISDYDEAIGFTFNGITWYTDPNDMDTNNDTLMDGQEWDADEDGEIDDTDGDGVPDVFDQDNDGDGVMDYDDDAPWTSTMDDAGESLNLSINGLQTNTPTLVDFQIRPDNPDHLWYANNVLDWPDGDTEGNIQDYDGNTFADEGLLTSSDLADYGDMTLFPMLQIRVPDGSSQLPYGESITIDLEDSDDASDAGSVVVAPDTDAGTFTINPDDDTSANGWSYTLVEGECDDLDSATDVGSVGTGGTISSNLQDLLQADEDGDGYAEERISHAIVASSGGSTVACGDMGTIVFEDGNLIDHDKLDMYGVSVSDDYSDTTGESWKLIYVPLSVVNDSYTNEQVAFSGSMYYMPRTSSEWEDHQVELVWMLQMLTDSCDEYVDDSTVCETYESFNEESFIYAYNDDWYLAGLTVREDHGAEMGIIFEDMSVDTDLEYGTTAFGLANDLATLFMIDETMTVDTLTRYDYTYTGSDSEAADYSNNLRVETMLDYETLQELLMDVASDGSGTDAILEEYYTSYAQSDPDFAALLLFARQELGRTITLDALDAYMQWSASDSSLAVDMDSFDGTGTMEESDDRSVSLAPYQYDADDGWQSYDIEEYLESLEERYDPETSDIYDDIDWSEVESGDTQDNRQGLLDILELFILALYSGVSDTAMVGDTDLYDEEEAYDIYRFASVYASGAEDLITYVFTKLYKKFKLGNSLGLELSLTNLYHDLIETRVGNFVLAGLTVLIIMYVILEFLLDLGLYEVFLAPSEASLGARIAVSAVVVTIMIAQELYIVYKAWDLASRAAMTLGQMSTGQYFMRAMKMNTVRAAKANVAVSIIVGLIVIGTFIYMWASGSITFGTMGFNMALAYMFATLFVIAFTVFLSFTVVGTILLAILAIVDAVLMIFGEETVTEKVTQALAKGFYDVFQLSEFEDPEFDNISQVVDTEVGFAHGGTVDYSMDITTTFKKATNRWPEYSNDEDQLSKTSMEYELSSSTSMESVSLNDNKNDWYITMDKPSGYSRIIYGTKSDYVEQTIPLVSGVNYRPPSSNLNFAYAIPLLEHKFYLFWQEWNILSAKGTDTMEIDSLVYDVVPASIDDFFALSSATGGGYRLAWDSQFPALADADGDGLLSTAQQGSDPDDSTWDADGDGLPDLYELEQQEEGNYFNPKDSDSDGDGLPDWEENFFGSNPADSDTDNDGLYDCEEVYYMLTTAEDRAACDSFLSSQTSGTDTARSQGGWQVIIGGQGSLTTYAMSDPTVADTDEDGLNDFAEYELRTKGYHPQVENPNPVAVTSALLDANGNKLDDGNGYAKPGDSVILRNIVSTSQTGSDSSTEWANTLQIELPDELGGDTRTTALDLVNDEESYIYETLDVPSDIDEGGYAVTSEMIARTISNASGNWTVSVEDAETLTNLVDDDGLGIGIASMPSLGANAYLHTMRSSDASDAYIIVAPEGTEYSLGDDNENDSTPDVACNNTGTCLAVWSNDSGIPYGDEYGTDIMGSFIESDNIANASVKTLQDTEYSLDTFRPLVASDGTYFMVAYEHMSSYSRLMVSVYDDSGSEWADTTIHTTGAYGKQNAHRLLYDVEAVGDTTYLLAHEDMDGNLKLDTLSVTGDSWPFSVSNASTTLVSSSNAPGTAALAYAPAHNRVALVYEENGTIKRKFGDVSGSSITWEGSVEIGTGEEPSITYEPYSESWLVAWTLSETTTTYMEIPVFFGSPITISVPVATFSYMRQYAAYDSDGNLLTSGNAPETLDDATGNVACPDSSTVPVVHLALDETADSTNFANEYNDSVATCSGDSCPNAGVVGERVDGTTEIWASFDGTDDVLSVPDGAVDLANQSFTVAFWAKRNSDDGAGYVLSQGTKAKNEGMHIGFRDDDTFTCAFWLNSLNYDYTEDNDWHHWACTYNVSSGERTMYRDGVAVASETGRDAYTGSGEFFIGNSYGGSWYHGELDDVRIYQDVVLSADNIEAMYNDAEQSVCTNVYYANGKILYSNIAFTQNKSSIAQINNDDTVEVMVDTTAPSASFSSLNDGDVISMPNNGVKTISGSASDTGDIASGVGSVQVRVDSGDWEDATGQESWAYNLSGLSDGDHTIDVQATDAVGNVGSSSSIAFTIDNTAPEITLDMTENTIRLQRSSTDADKWIVSLVGTASDEHSTVETVEATLRGNDRTYTAQDVVLNQDDATWSMDYVLNDVDPTDTYAVEVTAEDILGNSTTATFERISVDMTAPSVGISSDANDVESITESMTFSGTISDTGYVASGVQSLEWSLISNDDAYHLENIAYERLLDLPFDADEPYVFPAQDASGRSNHAYCDDGTCPTYTSDGRIDGALEFDGVDDMLTTPEDAIDLANKSFSVSFWARRDSTDSGNYIIWQGSGEPNQGLNIGFIDSDSFACAFAYNALNVDYTEDGDWHHWTCTYDVDDGARVVYRDGEVLGSETGKDAYIGTGELLIGRRQITQYFEGALDRLQIYERALTENEVDALYHDADRVWYAATLGDAGATDTTWSITLPDDTGETLMEGYYQLDMRGTDMLNNRNDDLLTWALWNGEIDIQAPDVALTVSDNGDGTYTHTCTATDLNLDDTTMICSDETVTYNETLTYYESDWWDELQDETGIQQLIGIERQLDTTLPYGTVEACDTHGHCSSDQTDVSLVLDMSFESAPDNLTVADDSPYGNDATCDSEDTCPSLSDYAYGDGNAFVFDGVDDMLTISEDAIDLANKSFSVAFWAKRDGSGNSDYIIGQGGGGANKTLHIGFRSQDWFTFAFYSNDLNDTTAYTDNAWYHWTVTYDATTGTRAIYRDGVLRSQDTASQDYQGTGELLIGRQPNGDYFAGMLDELRIYNYALSADEVAALNDTSLLLYLPFEQEPEDDTIIDHSFHNNNATCVGDCPTQDMAGMVGNASSFAYINGYLEANWEESVSLADGFTLGAWVYPTIFDNGTIAGIIANTERTPALSMPSMGLYSQNIAGGFGDGTNWNSMRDRSNELPIDEWSHIATVFDGTTYSFYLNGEEVTSSTNFAGRTPLDLSMLYIAADDNEFGGYSSGLDEVRVYNRALDAFEIADLADTIGDTTTRAARGIHYNRMRNVMQRSTMSPPVDGGARGSLAASDTTVAILDPPNNTIYNNTDPISITVLAAAPSGIEDLTLTVNGEDAGVPFVPQSTTPITTTPGTEPEPEPEPQDQQQIYLPLVMQTNVALANVAPASSRSENNAITPSHTTPVTITLPITNTAPITYSIFHTEWTPPGDGWYDLATTVHASDGATATSDNVRIGVDTTKPETLISTTILTGYGDLTGAVPLMLRGTATDNTQVKHVQVRVGDSDWRSAIRDSNDHTWSISAQPFLDVAREPDALTDDVTIVAPDNETMPVVAKVTDIGGHTTVITENVTVDIARPSSANIAMSYTDEDGSSVEISAGDTVRIAPVTLSMAWDESTDASGIASYYVGWSTSATIDVNALTYYAANATRQHSYEAGEAEMLYAHLLIYDNNGNAHMQTVGPVYVDSPVTPDIVTTTDDEEQTTIAGMRTGTLRAAATRGQQRAPEGGQGPPKPLEGYADWQESGCAETGFRQQPPRNTKVHGADDKRFMQHFYTTWDDNGLQLTWQGANWDSDGDLYIYFDTQEGGSNIAFDPYYTVPVSPTLAQESTEQPDITLPFEADAMLWMSDTTRSALMLWDAASMQWHASDSLSNENTWYEPEGRRTNFYIPFDVLGMDDPANTTLQIIALASEKDALRLWATMPQGNALNSHRVINPFVPEHLRNKGYSLDRAYTWEGVGAGICPSDASGQQTAIDVALHVITDPPHPFYSIMGDGLFGVKDEVLNGTDTGNIDVGFRGQVSPNVHPGQEINVKVQYVNRSPRPSPPIILRIKSLGALTLPDGQAMAGAPRPRMEQLIQVGELAPHAQGEAIFKAYLDPDSTDTAPTTRLEIEVQTQRTLEEKRPPLDVYWATMHVDRDPPTNMRITSPMFPYLKPGVLELTGVVSDASEIRSVALELGNMEKPMPPKLCGEKYITGLQWTCPITIPLNTKADQMLIRAKATDIHGQESEWTEWKTYIVDTVPPTTTLHSGSTMAVAGPDTKPLQFAVQDNHMPVGAEVCRVKQAVPELVEGTRLVEGVEGTICTTYAAASIITPTDELTATGELSSTVLVRVPFNVPNYADGIVEYWEVRGFDSVGNMHTSPITGVYMLDSVAPVITVTQQVAEPVALSNYTTFSDTLTAEPVLAGTAADGGRVQRVVARIIRPATDDGQAQDFVAQPARYDADSGTWQVVPKLERTGEHTIIIRAYDLAGNMRETQQYTLLVE